MTPAQIKEAASLLNKRDSIQCQIEKCKTWNAPANVYLGIPPTRDYAGCYTYPAYVENFRLPIADIIEILGAQKTDVVLKLGALGVKE